MSDTSSTLPDGVAGITVSNSASGLPSGASMRSASPVGSSLGRMPFSRGSGGIQRVIHQRQVGGLEARIVEAEAGGKPAEDLGVRQRLAERLDNRFGALQPVMAVGAVEVVALELRRRRQHDVAERHALGHRDLDADGEDIFAQQAAPEAVLVGMHHDRIVVVDEQRPQRRVDVVALQMPADVEDVQACGCPAECRSGRVSRAAVLGKA